MLIVAILVYVSVSRALSQMKVRLKGAQKGHSLLKKKADALTLRFRQILSKIIEVCQVVYLQCHVDMHETVKKEGVKTKCVCTTHLSLELYTAFTNVHI